MRKGLMRAVLSVVVVFASSLMLAACDLSSGKTHTRTVEPTLRLVHTLDLKGIEIGTVTTEDKLKRAGIYCTNTTAKGGSGWCEGAIPEIRSGYDHSGDRPAYAEYLLENWRVDEVSVRFRSDDFELLSNTLRRKFGPPTAENTVVLRNAFGATFENPSEAWKAETGASALLQRYALSKDGKYDLTDGGELVMFSAESTKKFEATRRDDIPSL